MNNELIVMYTLSAIGLFAMVILVGSILVRAFDAVKNWLDGKAESYIKRKAGLDDETKAEARRAITESLIKCNKISIDEAERLYRVKLVKNTTDKPITPGKMLKHQLDNGLLHSYYPDDPLAILAIATFPKKEKTPNPVDPGAGWRLLEHDEVIQEGDEWNWYPNKSGTPWRKASETIGTKPWDTRDGDLMISVRRLCGW